MDDLMGGVFATVGLSIGLTLVITIATLVFVFVVFRRVFGNIKQNNQLLTTGEPAQATVIQLWDTGVMVNNNPQIGMLLEVRPANRPAYQLETKQFVSYLRLPQVQPGSVVNVRLDPADPAKVALALM